MKYYVYVLKNGFDDSLYKGMTDDIDRRLKEHNNGKKTKSTKSKKPWDIFLLEEYDNWEEARERELYLKSGIGRQWLASLKNIAHNQ